MQDEAEIRDLLAALPPPVRPASRRARIQPTAGHGYARETPRSSIEKLARDIASYSDPKKPAPDIVNESLYTLRTYVLGRFKYDSDVGH